MKELLSPEGFMAAATALGFDVDTIMLLSDDEKSVRLTKAVAEYSEEFVGPVEVEARGLIGKVPLHIGWRRMPQGILSTQFDGPLVELIFKNVDLEWMEGLVELTRRAREARERREDFSDQFSKIVQKEIDEDPEVVVMTSALRASLRRVARQEAALRQKRAEMEKQKEGLREPYIFVVDDRQL